MLHFSYALFISSYLHSLMFFVRGGKALLAVRGGMGVRDSYVKVCSFKATSPKPIRSNVQSGSILRDDSSTSESFTCDWLKSWFYMQISLHTSDNQPPIVSHTSLCRMDGNPPLGQERECSTEKSVPQAQLVGHFEGSHP